MTRRVFISADHGLAIVYFLQSDVIPYLLSAGVEVVLLTDDALRDHIDDRFGCTGLVVEALRFKRARSYLKSKDATVQYWLDFLRRAGASNQINLEAVDSYILQVQEEAEGKRTLLFPAMRALVEVLRRSRLARRKLVDFQRRYTPNIYGELFNRYKPEMVISSTPGWRLDRYLLREASAKEIPTTTVIVGWDNTSSYSLPGAPVDHVTCWSQIQKEELILGADWHPDRVHIGGIPSYDGYFKHSWLMPKEAYFKKHGLDPERKLIAYASSFITFSPNIQNIEALAQLVSEDKLAASSQLLVRLHPNHFMDVPRFAKEREQIRKLAQEHPHVHMVEPVPLGGELGYYSGEDMDEKSSMMMYADVFTTVYSTMVVEASTHGTPVVSVCIDHSVGWQEKFYLPLSEIGGWPTHARFRQSGAGRVALTASQLREAINYYLENTSADAHPRRKFVERECTYTDGSAGKQTGNYLLDLLD